MKAPSNDNNTDIVAQRKSSSQKNDEKKLVPYQLRAFFLTAMLYSSMHALRTSWGYSKPYLADANPYYSSSKLGILDFTFTIFYALGQYANGWLGDRLNLKLFLFGGSFFAVFGLFLFGYLEGILVVNNLFFGILAFGLNGIGQSTGYPGSIHIMTNWFSHRKGGLVYGLWGANMNIGNILGQQIGRITINEDGLPWEYSLFVSCAVLGFFLVLLLIFIKIHPKDVKLQPPIERTLLENTETVIEENAESNIHQETKPIGFLDALKIKHVPYFALTMFCLKSVLYGILLWLPFYLVEEVGLQGDISLLLASIEIGTLVGAIGFGFLSDHIKSRSIIIMFGFFFSVIFLVLTFLIKGLPQKTLYFILFLFVGLGLGGPSVLIGGAVISDLGRLLAHKSSVKGTSTITGIIEGCGSVGGAITQIILANFTSITFPFFAILCFVGGSVMIPIALEDYRRLKRHANEGEAGSPNVDMHYSDF